MCDKLVLIPSGFSENNKTINIVVIQAKIKIQIILDMRQKC